MKFKFYSDPGHGWLAVKRTLLTELNIIDKITRYSYQKGSTVYLEEDMDATTFIEAWKAKHGNNPEFVEKNSNNHSPIRSYQNFQVTQGDAIKKLILDEKGIRWQN